MSQKPVESGIRELDIAAVIDELVRMQDAIIVELKARDAALTEIARLGQEFDGERCGA